MYVICLCSYFAIVFMALLDRFSVVFKCSKTVWGSFAIILMGNDSIAKSFRRSLNLFTLLLQLCPSP